MDSRQVDERAWERVIDLLLQNATNPALLELFPLLDLPPAVFPAGPIPAPDQNAVVEEVAPAQPAATLAPAAHIAGGDAASPGFFITTQEALDSDIVLAVPVRAKDLAPSEEEDYGHTSDEEVKVEDHGEDKYWSKILFDQTSKSTALPQPQPPPERCTVIQAYSVQILLDEDDIEEEFPIIVEARIFMQQIPEENDINDSDLEQFDDNDPEIVEEFLQMQQAVEALDDVHPQELAVAQDQVERPQELVHEADPLNQAALVSEQPDSEEDQLAGLKVGAVGSTTTLDMSPTLSSTTLRQDQPGAIDVSPAASSITVPELPEDDVPAEATDVNIVNSLTITMVEADDASINKSQEEVARPHIATPALALNSATPMIAVRSEDAADSEMRLVSSLDPIQDQAGSIASTALQKEEQVTSSKSSELIFDMTT